MRIRNLFWKHGNASADLEVQVCGTIGNVEIRRLPRHESTYEQCPLLIYYYLREAPLTIASKAVKSLSIKIIENDDASVSSIKIFLAISCKEILNLAD